MKKVKYIAALAVVTLMCIVFAVSFSGAKMVEAEGAESMQGGTAGWQDGTYTATYEVGGTSAIGKSMISNYFDSSVTVDKIGDNYYMSLSLVKSVESMQNLTLSLDSNTDGKAIGQEITESTDSRKTYRYTLSYENLISALNYSVYISAMGTTQTFTITLDLDGAEYVGELGDAATDRPAQFVPTISTSAGSNYEVTTGTYFAIPAATAALGTGDCDVTYSVYYQGDGDEETVDVSGGSFYVENSGVYRLVYRAESSVYKTMLGANTYSEYVVTITAAEEVAEVAYFKDSSGAINQSATLQASKISSGAVYDMAAESMADISENYEVFSVLLYDGGEEVALSGEAELYILTSLNTSKAAVYYMDGEGSLTRLSSQSDGEYAVITTDKTGTFIVCIPGVSMSKMTKMIILAAALLVMIIAVAVTVPVVVHKKRKKKRLAGK